MGRTLKMRGASRSLIRSVTAAFLVGVPLTSGSAAPLLRIASINLCTDQLLLTMADPEQIVGLSPYARDATQSWAAAQAARFPILSGEAEDVLELKPDVVLAADFTKRATRELLKQQGLRVEEFDAVLSIEETEAQIRRMGEVVGHSDRAAAQIAGIDAALARARDAVARRPFRVLEVSRRGWISGRQSLITSMLSAIGLANGANDFGFDYGGYASLESIISARPDFLLLSRGGDVAEDEGSAFLLHPALERLYPPSKRMIIPERLTVCGGPMLADALDRLVAEFERVSR
jgi:iron complex transport system substrate-binding protein